MENHKTSDPLRVVLTTNSLKFSQILVRFYRSIESEKPVINNIGGEPEKFEIRGMYHTDQLKKMLNTHEPKTPYALRSA
tara:strand:+ start:134 stop:370 length:237 start_codon:yes stop_codon:yes gene_type:complete